MSASWCTIQCLYLRFGVKLHKQTQVKTLLKQIYSKPNFINTGVRLEEARKSYHVITYDHPTKPGDKKVTNSPLPYVYSPRYVEAAWYDWWIKKGYFNPNSESRESDRKFILCLPPPNVTGTLHLGHALTSAIQDALVRWNRMQGWETVWVPGCDHAGIATQVIVEKKLWEEQGLTRHELGRERFLEEIWKWKNEKGDKIFDQLKKLGCSLDWTRTAFTMDEKLSKAVVEAFVQLFDEGLIYRSNRLVNWSCQLKSAISDIEVDNITVDGKCELNVPGYSKPVAFGLMESFDYPVVNSDEKITVSTTRLETMLGDTAIAIHPDDDRYKHLHGKSVCHPLDGRELPIICDEFVEKGFGTGAVKITPAHDFTDYEVGVRHKLPFLTVIDETGRMINVQEGFQGQKRFEARSKVREALEQRGMYKGSKEHSMVIPTCSRSKDVIEPLLKPQWYVDSEEMYKQAIQIVESGELTFTPDFYKKVWYEWLHSNRDWCISRQLWWGHRIPAYRVTQKSQTVEEEVWVAGRDESEARHRAAKKLGVPETDIVLEQDEDVLDTWFSSGLFPFSVHGWPEQTKDVSHYCPCSLMETGHDILFFWVARMVMMGQKLTGKLPFSKVLLHGLLRDAHGRKMSKSLGNVIDPMDVISGITLQDLHQQIESSLLSKSEREKAKKGQRRDFPDGIPECGADALRFALCSYDVKSPEINMNVTHVQSYRHFCNKVWQAFNFVNSNLGTNFKPAGDFKSVIVHGTIDQWILARLSHMVRSCDQHFQSYDLHFVTQSLYNFWLLDFCAVYIESVKPVFQSDSETDKLIAQEVLHFCVDTFLRALSPFMPFLSEELFQRLVPRGDNWPESVCVAQYPQPSEYQFENNEIESEMEAVKSLCSNILSMIQQYRLPRKKTEVYVLGSGMNFDPYHTFIGSSIRTKALNIVTDVSEIPASCLTHSVSQHLQISIPVMDFMDGHAETAYLKEKLQRLEQKLLVCQKNLNKQKSHGKFPHAIEDLGEKVYRLELEREKLQQSLDTISKVFPDQEVSNQ